jgi:predicted phosphodiesterase
MRVFALSDVHVDYDANARWVAALSGVDYLDDVLILAGDVSDSLVRLERTLSTLVAKFRKVLFVPGNHELWVIRDENNATSLEKFRQVCLVVERSGASMQTFRSEGVVIVPLLSWYDYSFGLPSDELRDTWMDYRACRWPSDLGMEGVAQLFESANHLPDTRGEPVISFSHFLPRIDVMPERISARNRTLYPVLGSARLDHQVRAVRAKIHVYGHSHVNRCIQIDGVTYVNNAFGYPHEGGIASKRLLCIHSTGGEPL